MVGCRIGFWSAIWRVTVTFNELVKTFTNYKITFLIFGHVHALWDERFGTVTGIVSRVGLNDLKSWTYWYVTWGRNKILKNRLVQDNAIPAQTISLRYHNTKKCVVNYATDYFLTTPQVVCILPLNLPHVAVEHERDVPSRPNSTRTFFAHYSNPPAPISIVFYSEKSYGTRQYNKFTSL